jgi:hypothetical protein
VSEKFAVVGKHGRIIEVFDEKAAAKKLAQDFHDIFRCPMPKIVLATGSPSRETRFRS